MSCRRGCAIDLLFSCLRAHPHGIRTCVHERQWRLTSENNFYVVQSWSPWRRKWVTRLAEGVMDPEERAMWNM